MAYLGNTPTQQAFTPAIDYFNGNASTTAFTLSRQVASVAQIQVTVDNVAQNPSSAYSVSGNTITFTSAPLTGVNNIYVYYTSPITQVIATSGGTTLPIVISPTNITPAQGATAIQDPVAMTATAYYALYSYPQNNSQWQISTSAIFATTAYDSGNQGAVSTFTKPFGGISTSTLYYWRVRYRNSVTNEWSAWSTPTSFTTSSSYTYAAEYLVVGGGGSGTPSNLAGTGGGGGQLLTAAWTAAIGTAYTVTVGAGGTGSTSATNAGVASSISTIATAAAGTAANRSGSNNGPGGAATWAAGGGGGDSAVGGNAGYHAGATGGAGTLWTPNSTYYGGGGGGGSYSNQSSRGAGGIGGGGTPGWYAATSGTAGTTNTGGGGGGAGSSNVYVGNFLGGGGGSGIVIIRYLGAQRGTGGTYTSVGGYSYHTFTTSGTYTA